jgi:proton glutamate symport protein
MTIDSAMLLRVTPLAVILSFTTPGVPAGGLLVAAPLFTTAGVPVEGIGLLIALDMIADMFRAPANVTADLAVATILARQSGQRGQDVAMRS